VGEMSLLTGAPRSADVYSRTAATLLEIKKQDLAPILKNNPALIGKISQDLTAKLALNAKLANQKQDEEKNEDASKGLANKILKFFFQ
jgi:CRP-like cAMP-binding protein